MSFTVWAENATSVMVGLYSSSLEAFFGKGLYCFYLRRFDFIMPVARMVFAQGLGSFLH